MDVNVEIPCNPISPDRCDSCGKSEDAERSETDNGEKKQRLLKFLLAGLLAICMALVIAAQPYATYPGGTAPFFMLISTFICLVVSFLLTL